MGDRGACSALSIVIAVRRQNPDRVGVVHCRRRRETAPTSVFRCIQNWEVMIDPRPCC